MPVHIIRGSHPGDVAAIARAHGVADDASIRLLADASKRPGGLRNVVKVISLARFYQGDGLPTGNHIAAAMTQMNLRPRRTK